MKNKTQSKIENKLIPLLAVITFCFTLMACSDNAKQEQMLHEAVQIESSDECHLCGMLITRFDGPKGELFRKEQGAHAFKFCSTRDMFSYYLDPENKRNVSQMLVHDMSKMPWDAVNNDYFIDAKTAWYVSGSEKKGAMGKTLASFSAKEDAIAFAHKFGGNVLDFNAVSLDVLL